MVPYGLIIGTLFFITMVLLNEFSVQYRLFTVWSGVHIVSQILDEMFKFILQHPINHSEHLEYSYIWNNLPPDCIIKLVLFQYNEQQYMSKYWQLQQIAR